MSLMAIVYVHGNRVANHPGGGNYQEKLFSIYFTYILIN